MDRIAWRILPALLLLAASPQSWAQASIVETRIFGLAEPQIGSEYRDNLRLAMQAIEQGDLAAADAALEPIRVYCEAQQRPGRPIVSVSDSVEYDLYMASRGDDEPTEWIDIACPSSYHLTGYMFAGTRHLQQALPWLERAIAIAPYLPDPHNERGFVLAQMGRLDEALAAYRKALALADSHPNAAYIKPLALRGVGYVLTEMGDLDGAQRAYEDSLKLEPDNPVAKNELEYIARRRLDR